MKKLLLTTYFNLLLLLWISMHWVPCAQAENRWAVIIGISQYQDPRANLKYPSEDAKVMYRLLSTKGYIPEQNILLLSNDKATKARITEAFRDWLPSRVAPGDHAIIYYSGHGIYGPDVDPKDELDGTDEYLAPYDVDLSSRSNAAKTSIRDDSIAQWLRKLPSETLVIFDSCYSGGGIKAFAKERPKTLDELFWDLEGEVFLGSSKGGMQEDITNLPELSHVTFLAASQPDQRAWEDESLNQSVFTYYLTKGLEGDADLDQDGQISVSEAFTYVQQQLASDQKWGWRQQPFIELRKDLVLVSLAPLSLTEETPSGSIVAEETPPGFPVDPSQTPVPIQPPASQKIKLDLWFDVVQADGTVKPGIEGPEYRSGDVLRLSFRVAEDCYLFVFNVDQKGHIHRIYPGDPQADQSVRVVKNQMYTIFGKLDDVVGVERFYAVASDRPFSLSQDVLPEVYREFREKNLQLDQMQALKLPFSYATIMIKHW